ncbi:hypothetical protein F4561_001701 [Lipingzhangella halophila]|uniref:Lanthionine synthetase-like protein n=1 Tax=Lipingzhangella halophila TaxID=1783352 RepID=A0A7W7RGA2_9ACTN|nr:lanthionine synthetase LanC family protein [Lipingzhangella halophila]MBB4930881.1 hypothetical protein [Lipingzhangella halophila]
MTTNHGWLRLARTLYGDAEETITAEPNASLRLDLALAALEFSRATGEDFGAEGHLRSALDLLRAQSGVGPWLYGGAAQAGWVAIRLAESRGTAVSGLAAIDETVLGWATDFPAERDIDLPMGLLGLGVYGLAHPDPGYREKLTAEVLDRVAERTKHDDNGRFVQLGTSEARIADQSAGARIIGVAHGTAGLVSYLASAAAADPAQRPRARALLDECLRWLLRQRNGGHGSVFPHRVETRYAPTRATWCSGDPGAAAALRVAERATGDRAAGEVARAAARAVVHRPDEDTGVVDGCVCHGAAGLVWFGRFASDHLGTAGARGDSAHWAKRLARWREAGPLIYFGPAGWVRNASFLEGDIGAALALLYAATGTNPLWSDLLLAAPITAAPG